MCERVKEGEGEREREVRERRSPEPKEGLLLRKIS